MVGIIEGLAKEKGLDLVLDLGGQRDRLLQPRDGHHRRGHHAGTTRDQGDGAQEVAPLFLAGLVAICNSSGSVPDESVSGASRHPDDQPSAGELGALRRGTDLVASGRGEAHRSRRPGRRRRPRARLSGADSSDPDHLQPLVRVARPRLDGRRAGPRRSARSRFRPCPSRSRGNSTDGRTAQGRGAGSMNAAGFPLTEADRIVVPGPKDGRNVIRHPAGVGRRHDDRDLPVRSAHSGRAASASPTLKPSTLRLSQSAGRRGSKEILFSAALPSSPRSPLTNGRTTLPLENPWCGTASAGQTFRAPEKTSVSNRERCRRCGGPSSSATRIREQESSFLNCAAATQPVRKGHTAP